MSKDKKWSISGKIIWDENDPSAYATRRLSIVAPTIDEAKETFKQTIQPKVVYEKFPVVIYDEECYEENDD